MQEAIKHFADFENCQRFMIQIRWPDGKVRCPYCSSNNVTYLKNARLWKCYGKHPRPKFSLKVRTILEDSAIGLEKWLAAMWLAVNCRNGMSSYEIARNLGVTQKTAWFMMHRIRLAAQTKTFAKLSGEVEPDQTFIGGKRRNMQLSRRKRSISGTGGVGKVAGIGIPGRRGEVRTKVVPNVRKKNLQAEVREHVEPGSHVFTD